MVGYIHNSHQTQAWKLEAYVCRLFVHLGSRTGPFLETQHF